MSSAPHVRTFPYLGIAYVLFLIQFALLGLFVASSAVAAAPGLIAGLGTAWAIALIASGACFLRQAAVNRRGGDQGAGPIRHLIIPVESAERIAEYEARYHRGSSADVAALPQRSRGDDRRVAA